jgi:hypothetical protein
VDIKVLDVSKKKTEDNDILTRWDIEVKAEVRKVRRTRTELKPGSRILIRYSAHRYKQQGWTGPGSQPVLAKGELRSAVLNVMDEKTDRYYIPGGARYSTFGDPAWKPFWFLRLIFNQAAAGEGCRSAVQGISFVKAQ